jgi:hypothetical protein
LLKDIHPDLAWDAWLDVQLSSLATVDISPEWELADIDPDHPLKRDLAYSLWLMRLTPARAMQVSTRLKLPIALSRKIQSASELWRDRSCLVGVRPSAVVQRLEDVLPLPLFAVYLAADQPQLRQVLQTYVTAWKKVQLHTSGEDLKLRGVSPGPVYKHILGALRDAWLDGTVTSVGQEQALLEEIVRGL